MQFIDQVKVIIKAGDGGRGCVGFRREKYVPKGGPSGGDGGRGGHIIFQATSAINTLLDIKYQQLYSAEKGQHGMGSNMHGRNGKDLIIPVPLGTLIRDFETNAVLCDLTEENQEFLAAKGGRGGLGNAHFKSATRQAPRFAQPGEPGEELTLTLELKLLADVGLIGLPNAGKSTLISALSSARPKIADYPFTTLVPNLGVVKYAEYKSFVIADIPGLIEGAHTGTGLGFQFLRHVERTSVLLHLVDISEMAEGDPSDNLEKINKELELFSPELIKKPQAVAGTKLDIKGNGKRLDTLAQYCNDKQYDFFPICAVTGKGLKDLLQYLARTVEDHKNR
ncbi:GTPase ObgE [candidate division WS5 bacterium]|uniref:GTPase Obg n=1 Tax=candidate division WS5 bacterium TaxID=2093353 RepID=A0A419DAL3_9BACT|nr:MAG: GTPase ObgE [candidate division WS5 bacterium]